MNLWPRTIHMTGEDDRAGYFSEVQDLLEAGKDGYRIVRQAEEPREFLSAMYDQDLSRAADAYGVSTLELTEILSEYGMRWSGRLQGNQLAEQLVENILERDGTDVDDVYDDVLDDSK